MSFALNSFTNAYITCALWTSGDEEHESYLDSGLFNDDDIAPLSIASIRNDCALFFTQNEPFINGSPSGAGHDFWLTRNGHGAGFWDGDWPDEIGKLLTQESKKFGESCLYRGDDGLLHISPIKGGAL